MMMMMKTAVYLYLEQRDDAATGSTMSICGVLSADKWNPTASQAKLTIAPIKLPKVRGRRPILSTK